MGFNSENVLTGYIVVFMEIVEMAAVHLELISSLRRFLPFYVLRASTYDPLRVFLFARRSTRPFWQPPRARAEYEVVNKRSMWGVSCAKEGFF